jgi:hypothetical protein
LKRFGCELVVHRANKKTARPRLFEEAPSAFQRWASVVCDLWLLYHVYTALSTFFPGNDRAGLAEELR